MKYYDILRQDGCGGIAILINHTNKKALIFTLHGNAEFWVKGKRLGNIYCILVTRYTSIGKTVPMSISKNKKAIHVHERFKWYNIMHGAQLTITPKESN